jgi:hypothetical protein
VPPACSKPFEQAVLCRRLVEVEGLGIELGGERLYRRGIDRPRRGGEFLAGRKILEKLPAHDFQCALVVRGVSESIRA